MRRQEFSIDDVETAKSFLESESFGYLATVGEDGWPRVKPMNYVSINLQVFVHGSKRGEKVDDLARCQHVTFSVARELAIIPSYFSHSDLACPATSYFQSVTLYGSARLVDNLDEKTAVFTAFMEKLQPEGGYAPIRLDNPEYVKNLQGVNLICISPERWSAKFKLGQNLASQPFESIREQLVSRGLPEDIVTADLMERFSPPRRPGPSR